MAPRTWATDEQTEWLQSFVEDYVTYAGSKNYDTFWTTVNLEWFEQWPERLSVFPGKCLDAPLTPAEIDQLGAAVNKRKKVSLSC